MMSPKLAVFGTFRFPPERVADVLPHLQTLVEMTNQHDGCIAYDVAQDPFDPGLFRFSELWPDAESFAKHMEAPHVGPWRAAIKECGLIERKFTAYQISGSQAV